MKLFSFLLSLFFSLNALAENPKYEEFAAFYTHKTFSEAKTFADLFSNSQINSNYKEFLLKQFPEIGKSKLPKISLNKRTITFESDNQTTTMLFQDSINEKFSINGYEADFSKYPKMEDKFKYLERILQKKSATNHFFKIGPFLFFNEKSHAFAPLLIGAWVFAGAGISAAAIQACRYQIVQGWCTNPDVLRAGAVGSLQKYTQMRLTDERSSEKISVQVNCKKKILVIRQGQITFYDNSNPRQFTNQGSGKMSYQNIVSDFSTCCENTNSKEKKGPQCESDIRAALESIGNDVSNGDSNMSGIR